MNSPSLEPASVQRLSLFGQGEPPRRVMFFGLLVRQKCLDLFFIPHNLVINITPLCVGLPDAISGSQFIDFIKQAQFEKLLTTERSLRIV